MGVIQLFTYNLIISFSLFFLHFFFQGGLAQS